MTSSSASSALPSIKLCAFSAVRRVAFGCMCFGVWFWLWLRFWLWLWLCVVCVLYTHTLAPDWQSHFHSHPFTMQIDSANNQTCKHVMAFTYRISLGFAIRLFMYYWCTLVSAGKRVYYCYRIHMRLTKMFRPYIVVEERHLECLQWIS